MSLLALPAMLACAAIQQEGRLALAGPPHSYVPAFDLILVFFLWHAV